MRSAGTSFRMVMTQERRDLMNNFFEREEFRNVKTRTQLIEAVFQRYLIVFRELERIKQRMLDWTPKV